MRKRTLGKTGLEVTELALGTWALSGDAYGPSAEVEVDRVIDRALELGIDTFDTADSYGAGEMERKLGERLSREGTPPSRVVTKIGTDRARTPPVKRFDAAYLREATERSRDRLHRERIDVVLLHNPAPTTLARDEVAGAMNELVAAGTIAAWGVAAGDGPTTTAAIVAGAQVLELAYNAFHPEDLRDNGGLVQLQGPGVIARSVLSHGLLTGIWSSARTFPPDDHRSTRWTPAGIATRTRQVEALRTALSGQIHTLRAVALRWVLADERVGTAVLGPRTALQLDQLVRDAGSGPPYFPPDMMTKLENAIVAAGIRP